MQLFAVARDANHYDITRDITRGDRVIATVILRVGGSGRVNLADGGAMLIRRDDLFGARYTITRDTPAASGEEPRAPLLRAARPNPLRRNYDVETAGRHITLRAEAPWRGDYLLSEGGAVTGSIRHAAARARDAAAALPDDLPQDAAIALFCLVLAIWRHGHARVDTL